METQTEGYLLVLKPKARLARYEEGGIAKRNADPLKKLRDAFKNFPHEQYRGISRDPLFRYGDTNVEARRRIREILGEEFTDDIEKDIDDDLLPSPEDARSVLALVDCPDIWEIIHVSRVEHVIRSQTLGYDIGCWGGDHFSLIADTIVIPQWHPPVPEGYQELAATLTKLNRNLLFGSYEDAICFRGYYNTKSWAEKRFRGDFDIIQVNEIS